MRRFSTIAVTLAFATAGCGSSPQPGDAPSSLDEIPADGLVTVKSPSGERVVRYHRDGKRLISAGDELLGEIGKNVSMTPMSRTITATTQQWPVVGGLITVPYDVSYLTSGQLTPALAFINLWNASGVVNFKPRASETNYITLYPYTGESGIGMQGPAQPCYLGSLISGDNASQAQALHQLGHSLGLFHEQQRVDRGFFVQVSPEMGPWDPSASAIAPANSDDFGLYDVRSVMQMTSAELQEYRFANYYPEDGLLQLDGTPLVRNTYGVRNGDAFALHSAYMPDLSSSGDVTVSLSKGSRYTWDGRPISGGFGFAPPHKVLDSFSGSNYLTGDVDGSLGGIANLNSGGDLIAILLYSSNWALIEVSLSDKGGFNSTPIYSAPGPNFCVPGQQTCEMAYADPDLNEDLFSIGTNGTYLARANPAGNGTFQAATYVGPACPAGWVCKIAKINVDSIPDLVQISPYGIGAYYPGQWNGTAFSFGAQAGYAPYYRTVSPLSSVTIKFIDVNNDGRDDAVLYDPADRTVHVSLSNTTYASYFDNGSYTAMTFSYGGYFGGGGGYSGDVFDVGDFSGDGYADVVLFSPQTFGNTWVGYGHGGLFHEDNGSQQTYNFGGMPNLSFANPGQTFLVGDFDKDGRSDIAKFNN